MPEIGLEPKEPRWLRRFDRRAMKRYAHLTPWRPCYQVIGGVCLRCLARDLFGIHRRERARLLETLTPAPHDQPLEGL